MTRQCACALLILLWACAGTARAVSEPEPHLPVPSAPQLKWHRAEQKMFIHFGIKTYTPSHWHMGNGKEDPRTFNPVRLDANQWVAAARAGGFNGMVVCVKHHSGWCNWPSQTTDFGVVSATWKDGKGDVIREYVDACRKVDMSIGYHITIIDENYKHRHGGYEGYADFYTRQWEELVTWYGPFDYYYVDGYELRQLRGFDFKPVADLITKHQPDAVFFDSGVLVDYLPERCLDWPGGHGGVRPDMGYVRKRHGKAIWYPLEPSMMFQGTWFHSAEPICDLDTMRRKYLISVGRGSTANFNVPPNQDGLIDAHSIERLKEYKAWLDHMYASDWARRPGVKITADNVRGRSRTYAAAQMLDGDGATYWATDDGVTDAVIEIDLGRPRPIDGIVLEEHIPLGERVNGYTVEYFMDGAWHVVFRGKRIGYRRILWGELEANLVDGRYAHVARKVRLTLTNAEACPLISTFQVLGSDSNESVILGLKPIAPEGNTITCQARDAGLAGGGLRGFFYWHGKLEGWKHTTERARWKIRVTEPGTYAVTLHQGDDKGGDTFNIEVAGNTLPGTVIATHGYKNFKDNRVGTVTIDAPGDYLLSIIPTRILHNDLMKLRWLTLTKQE